jgi:leucine dehydrogenase
MALAEFDQVIAPEHEEVHVRRGPRSGLTLTIAIHRTVGGRALGGCRMRPYETSDDAVRDAERLARAMTFKAGAAGLRIGGGKGVIAAPAHARLSQEVRRAALRDFAELIESFGGRFVSGQDVGTSEQDIAFMGSYTAHVAGRPVADGGCGDPSPYTAHGVEVAIRAALGGGSLSARHVVVVGLGHVGGGLAERLARAGARLTVTDADPRKRALAQSLGARWVEPDQVLEVEADVLAPCALGGMLDHEVLARLRVPVVAGAANNQLADESVAEAMRERGIRWAPDFVANAGGLIAVVEELGGFEERRAAAAVEAIADTLSEVFSRSERAGVSTLIAAQELASERSAHNWMEE